MEEENTSGKTVSVSSFLFKFFFSIPHNAFICVPADCLTSSRGLVRKLSCQQIFKTGKFACWFYVAFKNRCKAPTKSIYFNCCNRCNGFLYSISPVKGLSLAPGPTLEKWSDCSCKFNLPVKANSTYHLKYLAIISNIRKLKPEYSPWNTAVMAASFK